MSFVLVAKSTDHKVLLQWVEELEGLNGVEHMQLRDEKGRCHHYRWVNQVPLNGTRDADQVNFFEYVRGAISIAVQNSAPAKRTGTTCVARFD